MTDNPSYDRFRCATRLSRSGLALPASHPSDGGYRHPRTRTIGSLRPARPACPERHPIPRACFDDYLGGRSDRFGLELLFDLRRPVSTRRELDCALPLATPYPVREVLLQVRRRCPDLVWLYPGDPRRAHDVARRIIDTGVETIIIIDDEDG